MRTTLLPAAIAALLAIDGLAHDGMKFEPPDGMAYTGIGNDAQEAAAFEAVTAPFRLSHQKIYLPVDDGGGHPFNPSKFLSDLNAIGDQGQIPHLGLTFTGFDPQTFNPMDMEIANGKYDPFFTSVATQIKAFGKPIFIAIGIEFNFVGYTKGVFPQAWRHIVDLFRDQGVNNVAWIWNPLIESSAQSQFDDKMPNGDWAWWPGDEYVDGTSNNVFVAHAWDKNSTTQNALDLQRLLDWSEAHNKPMYSSETTGMLGIDMLPTSDPLAQIQALYVWINHFKHMFDYIECHDRAKGFIYISRDWTPFPQWGPAWGNQIIQINAYALQLFVARVTNGKYLNAGEFSPAAYSSHQIYKTSLGGPVVVDVHNVTPNQPAILFASLSKLPQGQKIGGVPYGKFWLNNPILLFVATPPTGSVTIPAFIPNNPLLQNLTIYTQWVSADGAPAPMKIEIQ